MGERAFVLSPAKVLPFHQKIGIFKRKICFQIFSQKVEILYRKQMVCMEILYK